uniref:Putative ovule protein n=1 Tax=Solanum chacoense TaxID=4108 RepID=A0A0V0HB79_SOLCH
MYLPHLQSIPLEKGMNWKPTWKSTPLLDNFVRRFQYSVDDVVDGAAAKYVKEHNIFVNLKHEIAAFIFNVNKIHSIQDGFFPWYSLVSKGFIPI